MSNQDMKTWMDELTKDYAKESKELKAYRESLDQNDQHQMIESETVSGMISDLQFSLSWMRRGRRPGSLRGIDRRDVYRRAALAELIRPDEQIKLLDALLSLSMRERQCFLLHMAHGLTITDIADRLKVSKGTAQTFVKRAKSKMLEAFPD